MKDKIIIPLDGMSEADSLALAERLSGAVWGFKVNDLLVHSGISIVEKLKAYGSVFADPKLHDIPNTVANGVRRLESAGADLITVHGSGGSAMLQAAAEATANANILAITTLTSLSDADAQRIYGKTAQENVISLATLAAECAVDGVVCSALELESLASDATLSKLLKVVPGIRPSWYGTQDDQTRVMNPKRAVELGANHLVIGRPITKHDDPTHAVSLVVEELS